MTLYFVICTVCSPLCSCSVSWHWHRHITGIWTWKWTRTPLLRSQNYLFPLQLWLSKSFGSGSPSSSGNSVGTTGNCYHRFYINKYIFHVFLWKNIDLIHMLDPIQYEFLFLFTTLADPELEPKLWYFNSGSSLKFRLLAAPAPQHWRTHTCPNSKAGQQ